MYIEKNKKIFLMISGLILIIAVFTIYIYDQLQPVKPYSNEDKVILNIPHGSTVNEITKLLKEKQLVKNELFFKIYLKYTGYDEDIKAGEFQLSRSMNIKEIIGKFVTGDVVEETVRFTIPEGYHVVQIAEILAQQGLINKDKFLQLVENGDFDFEFLKRIPHEKNMEYKLEGYLYPDTYEVMRGATEEEIINIMLAQFQKKWKPEWNTIIEKKGMNLHQIVTIASIVEREVVVENERPIVAGVIYNRLKNEWNLQIDATVQYILGNQKERLTYDDLQIKHPYNTYLNVGLPPGPISNPGISSIEAAIFPENHAYYFYVTKKDSSGEHYFSETYAEHKQYDLKSRGN